MIEYLCVFRPGKTGCYQQTIRDTSEEESSGIQDKMEHMAVEDWDTYIRGCIHVASNGRGSYISR